MHLERSGAQLLHLWQPVLLPEMAADRGSLRLLLGKVGFSFLPERE